MEKSRLSRLFSWFHTPPEEETGTVRLAKSLPRARRPSLGAESAARYGFSADRPRVDPMQHRQTRDPMDRSRPENPPSESLVPEVVQVPHGGGHSESAHAHAPVVTGHGHAVADAHGHAVAEQTHGHAVAEAHGHGHGEGHGDHGHGGHGHHHALVAKGTGGRLELHGNTLHLTKGGLFGFFVGLLGLHGGHAHQTIRVSDISAIEFEKHGFLFHYVRFCYPGAPAESGNHLHDMMADNALLMSLFDNRGLYKIKETIEHSMEAKKS